MRLLQHSYYAPAENLALDEALLDEAEAGRGEETLRLWTSPVHFVVLGLSQAVHEHVFQDACDRDGVPILRRCSAGGCVLQGPGCLNYSLVLRTSRPGCQTIHSSYRTILGLLAGALARLGLPAEALGTSDLAIAGRKISGSAQRRRRHYFLHHGTLLLSFDSRLCATYLREPDDQPAYRQRRSHAAFIGNIPTTEAVFIQSVSTAFQAQHPLAISPSLHSATRHLVDVKYSLPTWNLRS